MPLYQYTCDNCNEQFELRHKYGDKNITCTECGSSSVTKYLGTKTNVVSNPKQKSANNKVGQEVHKAIQENKEELDRARKELMKQRKKDD